MCSLTVCLLQTNPSEKVKDSGEELEHVLVLNLLCFIKKLSFLRKPPHSPFEPAELQTVAVTEHQQLRLLPPDDSADTSLISSVSGRSGVR